MKSALRRRADTHHASERLHEPLPCGDGSSFLGLGTGTTWAGFLLRDQMEQAQPQPLQRGFLNCFFWCGGPSGHPVVEDEDPEDEEDLAVGLPDVSPSPGVVLLYLFAGWTLVHIWCYTASIIMVQYSLCSAPHVRYCVQQL